jgi:hypothetical protein
MPDDRNKQQGQQGSTENPNQGGAHNAPGRNPQDDQSAGGQQQRGGDQKGGQDGGSYKEGGQNEQQGR